MQAFTSTVKQCNFVHSRRCIKPAVTIDVSIMDLHAIGGGYYSRGGYTIAYNAVFREDYYSMGATKQRGVYSRNITPT